LRFTVSESTVDVGERLFGETGDEIRSPARHADRR
jgi:hypothetical protein